MQTKKRFILLAILITASLFAASQGREQVMIHFAFDKYELDTRARTQLDSLISASTPTSLKGIWLAGHCDSFGDLAYNDWLSARRVEAIKNYLVEKGVSSNLFQSAEAAGERKPLNDNSTRDERQLNRRVEIILEKNIEQTPKPEPVAEKKLSDVIRDTNTTEGTTIVLRSLGFQPGRHFLLYSAQPILEELFDAMKKNPTLVIEIQGHVCCTPDDSDGRDEDLGTMNLSVTRARAVYDYLAEKGIPRDRMSYKGFGGSRKLFPFERSLDEQQQNRRVEIRIVSK